MPARLLTFQTAGRIVFGPGALDELPATAARLAPPGSPLRHVTEPGLVRAGLAPRTADLLASHHWPVTVFDAVEPDPRLETVEAAGAAARSAGATLVIGLGGGSALDVAKLAAVLARHDAPLASLFGIDRVPGRGLPMIALPTTAGTGSEVTPIAVVSDKADHLKKGVVSPHLLPDAALVDPTLALSLPPRVTAYTGVDALTHAIEAFTNRHAHPFVDTFALEAVRLAARHLRRAVHCGDDLPARTGMALGSLYGGLCLGPVNTAAVHALAYPLGGLYDVPHGLANSILLPAVMAFNLPADLPKYALLAEALGEPVAGLAPRAAAERAVEAVRHLSADVGIPARLRDLGLPADAPARMAPAALQVTRLLANNPRPVSLDDARHLYESCY